MKIYNWDYKYIDITLHEEDLQEDWNQTLVSILNEIVLENDIKPTITKYNENDNLILLTTSKKLKPLFNSLLFYNENNQKLSDKYIVYYENFEYNNILIGGLAKLEILNYKLNGEKEGTI